jgi:hypothetical protein
MMIRPGYPATRTAAGPARDWRVRSQLHQKEVQRHNDG